MTNLKDIVKHEIFAIDSKTGLEVKERQHYIQTEYFPNVELKQIFQSVAMEHKTDTPNLGEILRSPDNNSIYLSIDTKNGFKSRSVKITEEFKEWLKNRLHFNDLHPYFSLIETVHSNKWLLIFHYSEILGDTWLTYITKEQAQEFFKI